jgi:hypothetical protein
VIQPEPEGRIITFYSYKGGTGRSMILANVAWILASNCKRVLAVDWDLEAPGLHRYFYPFLVDKDITSSDGIINFVVEFKLKAMTPPPQTEKLDKDWYVSYANILRYAGALEWEFPRGGRLDFVPAGRQNQSYSDLVTSFDWQEFYEHLGGGTFIEAAKRHMKRNYDYILIDSRTGVSDTSGICTMQLPDDLVICYTLNNQSIQGAAAVAAKAAAVRGDTLRVFPVPMRVDPFEKDKLELRRQFAKEKFSDFPAHLSDAERESSYRANIQVPYIPYYAYEEILATFGDKVPPASGTLLESVERITSYLVGQGLKASPVREAMRQRFLGEFKGATPEPLIERAEEVLYGLSLEEQEAAKRTLTRLVRVAALQQHNEDKPVPFNLRDPDVSTRRAVDMLLEAGVVVSRRDEIRFANDAVVRFWPRLREWIDDDRDFLLWRQDLWKIASDWSVVRDKHLLRRGSQLKADEDWLRRRKGDLLPIEIKYIDASRSRSKMRGRFAQPAISLLLFFMLAVVVITVLSKMQQYWDVGSDSWFARLQGSGWEFQRGAYTVQNDQFGDHFSTVRYLWQGWKPADSLWFYTTTVGSDLLPYDFFMALEKAGTSEPFGSNENMNYYRYLPQKPTWRNPDALPVGFVKERYQGKDYLGFTCAACHTAQLNYNDVGIRIDGGPAGTDMDSFLQDLATAVWAVRTDTGVLRARFVKKVLDRGHYASEKDVVSDLQKCAQRLLMYNLINHSETRYGYSRLDAFGRIYNRVLEHVATQDELKTQLDSAVVDLLKEGTLTKSDIDSIMRQQKLGGVLNDQQRDDLVLRLSQVLPFKALVKIGQSIFNRPDAPVSYPFLWDTPQHDYVQWNGLSANAGLGSIGRNTGEVIGVFSTLNWQEEPGISLSSLIRGQGIKATRIRFDSSIDVHNLRLIEDQLKLLQSPQWPDLFPPIDQGRKGRGERLFTTYCESCHTRIKRDDPERRVIAHMSRLADIGTDPNMAHNAATYVGLSGILRNQYVTAGPSNVLINERAPVVALLARATLSVVATPEDKDFLVRGYQWVYDFAAGFFSNQIEPSLKQGNYDADTTADPYASLLSYKARPLNGIWATAPYLHNGSVPTLYDLLLPKKGAKDPKDGEYRPDTFQVGSREFDAVKVGLKSSGYSGFTFDTRHRGNSNAGHTYGTGLDKEQRLDLLEYLKTL